jgi:hypothetical protein
MERDDIIKIITEFTERHNNSKDGGTSIVIDIAKYFNNFSEEERAVVIEYLITELRKTNYDAIDLTYISILVEMKVHKAAQYIYDIYNRHLKYKKDFDWKKFIVYDLLKLRYFEAEYLYEEYIRICKERTDNGELFFVGVLYCGTNYIKGMDLLSDYFCKHLIGNNEKMSHFFENRMGFLILNFIDISKDYIIDILEQTTNKNHEAGFRLKEIITSYLLSDNVPKERKESMSEIVKLIENVAI